jgi:hypothetical protein
MLLEGTSLHSLGASSLCAQDLHANGVDSRKLVARMCELQRAHAEQNRHVQELEDAAASAPLLRATVEKQERVVHGLEQLLKRAVGHLKRQPPVHAAAPAPSRKTVARTIKAVRPAAAPPAVAAAAVDARLAASRQSAELARQDAERIAYERQRAVQQEAHERDARESALRAADDARKRAEAETLRLSVQRHADMDEAVRAEHAAAVRAAQEAGEKAAREAALLAAQDRAARAAEAAAMARELAAAKAQSEAVAREAKDAAAASSAAEDRAARAEAVAEAAEASVLEVPALSPANKLRESALDSYNSHGFVAADCLT